MIDTHAHIYASEFDNDRDEVVKRALEQGIDKEEIAKNLKPILNGIFNL